MRFTGRSGRFWLIVTLSLGALAGNADPAEGAETVLAALVGQGILPEYQI